MSHIITTQIGLTRKIFKLRALGAIVSKHFRNNSMESQFLKTEPQ